MLNRPSKAVITRVVVLFSALMAILVLSVPSHNSVFAQDSTIDYAENGEGPVATYTAVDPEGTAITSWLVEGTDAGVFMIENGVLSFEDAPDFEDPKDQVGVGTSAIANNNTYEVTVKAMDGTGKTSEKDVMVKVTNEDEPGTLTLSALQPQSNVPFSADVEDLDGTDSNHRWQWAKAGSSNGSYAAITAAISSMYTPKDADIGSWLRATVTYTDPQGSGKTAMMKSMYPVQSVRGANEAPEFAADQDPVKGGNQPDASREVPENSPAGTFIGDPVTATDADGDTLTYTLTDIDAADFDIDWATGQIMTKAKLDKEKKFTYNVTVRATDPSERPDAEDKDRKSSDTVKVKITVSDVNEPPEFESGAAEPTVKENEPDKKVDAYKAGDPESAATPTYSVAGVDGGKFTVPSGNLAFKVKPDYEMPTDANGDNVYEVTVQAADADGNQGMKMVKVTVENVEEDGTVTLDKAQPRVGIAVQASLEDPDGSISGLTWKWTDKDAKIALGGADTNSDTYTPVADDVGKELKAEASYTDGYGIGNKASGKSVNKVKADTRNKPPEFDDQDTETDGVQNTMATREVEENTKALAADDDAKDDAADNVGSPLNANDPDPNADELIYTLGGADAAMFRVRQNDPETKTEDEGGQIEVAAGTKLDYETKQTYEVTVTAEDSFGASASIDVTIKVKDLDEAPEIMVGGLAVSGLGSRSYAENGTDAVATYTVSPDTATASWTVEGDDAGDFDISNMGVLTFRTSPDFENPTDMGMDNVYQVTVKADDGANMNTQDVTVTVTNVDEDGVVTLLPDEPTVDIAVTASLTDPDGGITGTAWQWAKSSDKTAWTDITTATAATYTPVAADDGQYLQATARYTDGEGSDKMANAVTSAAVSITPPDACLTDLEELTAPVTQTGSWTSDCVSRYYSFTLSAEMVVEIDLVSTEDTLLVLLNEEGRDGTEVNRNDDVSRGNTNSALTETLAAGAYTIQATTFSGGSTGDFTLSVRPQKCSEDLGMLTAGISRNGVDWIERCLAPAGTQEGSYAREYSFTLSAAARVEINLVSDLDPTLFVLNADGTVAATNDDVGRGNINSQIAAQTFAAGTYTIVAAPYAAGFTDSFNLTITLPTSQ